VVVASSLFIMSYPGSFAESASWSSHMLIFAKAYFPAEALHAIERMYGSIGGVLLIQGIIVSPHARWLLSRPPMLWLGKVSFAVYLLHGMFLRTIFAWLLHIGTSMQTFTEPNGQGKFYAVERLSLPGLLQRAMATVVTIVCIGLASHVWNAKLEPIFARITNRLEKTVRGDCMVSEPKSNGSVILPLRKD
jgi:peptidoglycan/LPS O-acetylase OafA/YrhL